MNRKQIYESVVNGCRKLRADQLRIFGWDVARRSQPFLRKYFVDQNGIHNFKNYSEILKKCLVVEDAGEIEKSLSELECYVEKFSGEDVSLDELLMLVYAFEMHEEDCVERAEWLVSSMLELASGLDFRLKEESNILDKSDLFLTSDSVAGDLEKQEAELELQIIEYLFSVHRFGSYVEENLVSLSLPLQTKYEELL